MLKIIPPAKELSPFVAYYYIARLDQGTNGSPVKELCLPSGYAFMGFQTLGRCKYIFKGHNIVPERFYTSGQLTQKYFVFSDDPAIAIVGVAFKPTGLWHLFGLELSSLVDKVMPTTQLFDDALEEFTKRFDAADSPHVRKEYVEKLLMDQKEKVSPSLNLIDIAVKEIHENQGCRLLKDIAAKLNVSDRYFQKMFKTMVGIVPSVYSRIVRFNYLFSEMQSDGPQDYKSLAALFNYYDFPHFSKDFKRYCGESPSKFHVDKFHFLKEFMIHTPIGIPVK